MMSELKYQKDKQPHSTRRKDTVKMQNQARMEESEGVQSLVTQVEIQTVMALVMVMRETEAGLISGTNTVILREAHRQKHGRPAMKQPSFNWNVPDKYVELLNSKWRSETHSTKIYKVTEKEKVLIIKKWLGREGLQLLQIFVNTKKEVCKTVKGLFSILVGKFQPHHNEIILSLQYCKLKRKRHESTKE